MNVFKKKFLASPFPFFRFPGLISGLMATALLIAGSAFCEDAPTRPQLLTPEESQVSYETLLDLLKNPGASYASSTHLFYGRNLESLPTAAEVRDLNPNPVGYGSGIEDCTLYGGTLLFGLLDLYDLTHDEALRPLAYDAWLGLRNVGSAHHVKGFVSRGVHPDDPTATYVTSSRDQYTHYAEALWRYYRSPLSDETVRSEIRELLTVLADSLMEEITPENDFAIVRADGLNDPRGLHKMWNVYAHESARLPMIYAAAWDVTGDEKYRMECLRFLDDSIEDSLSLPTRPRFEVNAWVPTYSFYQMQCSLELLTALETDSGRRERLEQAIRQTAEFASFRFAGLVIRKAGRREFAEILIAQTILPELELSEEAQTHLKAILSPVGIRSNSAGQTVHLVRAYANACHSGYVPLPKALETAQSEKSSDSATVQPTPSEGTSPAEPAHFVWTEKPEAPKLNSNLVLCWVPAQTGEASGPMWETYVRSILTMKSRPAHLFVWESAAEKTADSASEAASAASISESDALLPLKEAGITLHFLRAETTEKIITTPRADFILAKTLTPDRILAWKERSKPFFVLLPSIPDAECAANLVDLQKNSPAFQGLFWGPASAKMKLEPELAKICFPIPLDFSYLQMDRWEFVLRPISFIPGDLKARKTSVFRMNPNLVKAQSDETSARPAH